MKDKQKRECEKERKQKTNEEDEDGVSSSVQVLKYIITCSSRDVLQRSFMMVLFRVCGMVFPPKERERERQWGRCLSPHSPRRGEISSPE
mmetsp:Transcript_24349/g.27630  ORF Transcript_24349/g.27630 Transcript_24349/m.27630 type:complete len:90 (+) Transcript_24349:116-385(+)